MLNVQLLRGAFALLLFLFFVNSSNGQSDPKTVVVFRGDETEVFHNQSDGTITAYKPLVFGTPAFVGGVVNGKEFLAVFCEAHYYKSGGTSFIGPAVRISYGNYTQWSNAQDFANTTTRNMESAVMGNVTAVMSGNKIYAIATILNKSLTLETTPQIYNTEWDTVMFVGTVVSSTTSSDNAVTIEWEEEKTLKTLVDAEQKKTDMISFSGGVGNGVITKNGTIILPIQVTYKYRDSNNTFELPSIMYSHDNGVTWKTGGKTVFSSSLEASVVEWSDGRLFLSARFDWGVRCVFESGDMGMEWIRAPTFMAVWGNNETRKGKGSQGSVITAPVDGKNVLLFSHPLNTDYNHNSETLQLWVSDGQRISCVGTISDKDKEKYTGNSILAYVGNKLYLTHEINPYGQTHSDVKLNKLDSGIALTLLDDFFERVKITVTAWRQLDDLLQSKGVPAKGLVGLWGNKITSDENVWEDIYNCVNATVKGGESVDGGFRFSGKADSGAKWPVRSQGQNQLYELTRYQFTFAATVTIHNKSAAESVSLFGASANAQNTDTVIGLGYTQEQKWFTFNGAKWKNYTNVSFELQKEYHVAITYEDKIALVYVDGVNITNGTRVQHLYYWIDHFYIGSTGNNLQAEGSSCTIKNVMLFNRSLKQEEIAQLSSVSQKINLDEPKPAEEPTSVLHNNKTGLSTKSNGLSDDENIKANNKEKESNNSGIDVSLSGDLKSTLEKRMNRTDGAAVSFGLIVVTSIVCSITVLF